MTQASTEQQKREVERALKDAEQGGYFQSKIFKHFFTKTDLMPFDNFYLGQSTLNIQILSKYISKSIC